MRYFGWRRHGRGFPLDRGARPRLSPPAPFFREGGRLPGSGSAWGANPTSGSPVNGRREPQVAARALPLPGPFSLYPSPHEESAKEQPGQSGRFRHSLPAAQATNYRRRFIAARPTPFAILVPGSGHAGDSDAFTLIATRLPAKSTALSLGQRHTGSTPLNVDQEAPPSSCGGMINASRATRSLTRPG